MSIRFHLMSLVLFCALGGLILGVFLIDRQYAIKRDSALLNSLQQEHHEVQRLEDQIKQLLVSTDLLFGSQETYMLQTSLRGVEVAQKMVERARRGNSDGDSALPTAANVAELLAALKGEIVTLRNRARFADFGVSADQLQRVDNLSGQLVEDLSALKQDSQQQLDNALKRYNDRHERFDFLAWSAVAAYLFSLLGSLWLASRAVSRPLTKLSALASQAISGRVEFEARPEGPSEVRSLATNISQFVASLQRNNAQSKALIEAIPDTLFVVHRRKGIVHIKPGIDTNGEILDRDPDWKTLSELLGDQQSRIAAEMIRSCFETQSQQHSELALGADDEQRFFEARATPINTDEVVVVIRDLTEKHQAEARIRHMAYHDSLTGLLNRRAFKDAITDHFERNPDGSFALFYVDVDRFKSINDTHGHDTGDGVLKHVTQCLSNCLRTDDMLGRANSTTGNLSARMGGDEFVVLLPGIKEKEIAETVAKRLQEAVSAPYDTGLSNVSVSVSIGMALYPDHGRDSDRLMQNADLAMFRAKRAGGAASCLYDEKMGESNLRKLTAEAKLKSAIANGDLFLTYQPKIDLNSRRIVGAEALIRWQDGDTVIPPDEFIPVAEETGLIIPLGEFVTATAVDQIAIWRSKGLDIDHIAINVSAAQLKQEGFYESVVDVTTSAGLPTSALNLEITESLLMGQYDNAMKVLTQFRDGGFSIAMDDFGTGYSSLSYIKDLPLDILKIDRAFVSGVTESATERAIIAAIIRLGRTLGLRIVAEGVETDEHARFLTKSKCDEAQGYLFSPPVTADVFENMLEGQAPSAQIKAAG